MVWSRVEQLLFTEPCSLVVVGSSQGFTKIGYSLGILHVEADLNQGTAGMGRCVGFCDVRVVLS